MTTHVDGEMNFITLGEITGALRRRWFIVVICALAGLAIGAGYVTTTAKSYTSEAQLVIDPITTDPFAANSRPVDAVNPVTERNVLQGSTVAQTVIEQLDLSSTPSELLSRVTVENPEGSLALKVAVEASTPKKAKALADTFAAVYLEQRSANAQAAIDKVVKSIDTELAAANQALAQALSNAAGTNSGTFAGQQAEAQLATLRTRIASLEDRRTALLTTSTSPGRITREADLPDAPDGIPVFVPILGAFAIMTTIGCGLALLLDRRGGQVRDRSAFEALVPGAEVDLPDDDVELDGAMGSVVLTTAAHHDGPALLLCCSVDATAPLNLTESLVDGLTGAGLSVAVIWTGSDSLPPDIKPTKVLEAVCSGRLDVVNTPKGDVAWVVPSARGGSSALARDDAPANVARWADQGQFDAVLIATPSPRIQPAAASIARGVDDVLLLVEGTPVRTDLAATVSKLSSIGVAVQRVVVVDHGRFSR